MAKITSNKRNAKNIKQTIHIQKAESISPSFGRNIDGERWGITLWGDQRVYDITLTKVEVMQIMQHWQKGLDASNARGG